MSIEVVTDVMRDALIRVLIVSAPVILVAMIVGLIISIFQATTQIQDRR